MFTLLSLIMLVQSILAFCLGAYILHLQPNNSQNRIIFLLCTIISYTNFCQFNLYNSSTISEASFWLIVQLPWIFIFPLLTHYSILFTQINQVQTRIYLFFLYLSAVIVSMVYLFHTVPGGVMIDNAWGWQFDFRIDFINFMVLIWLNLLVILSMLLLLRFYRSNSGIKKKQANSIILGLAFLELFSFANSILLITIDFRVPASVQFAFFISSLSLAWGVWKYELFRISPLLVASNIIENISNFLIVMDQDANIIDLNPTLERVLPFKKEEIIGKRIDIIFDKQDNSVQELNLFSCEDLLKTDTGGTVETVLQTSSGKLPVLMTLTPITINDKISGYTCIGTDLTLRKEIEKLQKKENALKELNLILNRVITTISHEFRTPLTSIQLAVSNIIKYREKLTTGQLEEIYKMISENTALLEKMINNLLLFEELDFKKIIDLESLEDYQPSRIIRQNLKFLNPIITKKQLEIDVQVSEEIVLQGDKFKINQIFYRVIENAVVYSNNKSRIEIKAYDNYHGDKNPLNLPGVLFTIHNEGIGLDLTTLEKIFTPFYRSK
ncbi:MAG: histidine kinase N-terminal 7TM domain-containing protein, partial [Candidatus Hodarchaeales archaeon]